MELPPEKLLAEVRDLGSLFIRSSQSLLTSQDYKEAELVFEVKPEDTPTSDIFAPDYNPDIKSPAGSPWMQWGAFRKAYQAEKQGSAEKWMRDKMVLSPAEVCAADQTTNGYVSTTCRSPTHA